MYQQNSQPSLLNLFVTVSVFLAAAFYGFITLNTEDPIWFWPKFDEAPTGMNVYCYGNTFQFEQDSEHLAQVSAMLNTALSGTKNWDSLSMSDETYDYYRSSDAVLVVELNYTQPVRVHSMYKFFSNVDSLVVPLDGRHSKTNAVFGRSGENTTAGSLHIASISEISDYILAQGFCAP
jgi:hypothetical protein